mmetsp:Transcript_64388/g.208939  ORF Transcript_64388/g.208939 Transcript_64388/m.208939 type:complete len:90 (-) Transcript_64388:62-331(-)
MRGRQASGQPASVRVLPASAADVCLRRLLHGPGHIFGGLAVAVAVPVGIIAMVLFWAVGRAPEAFDDYDDDYDDDGYEPQGPDKFMAPE